MNAVARLFLQVPLGRTPDAVAAVTTRIGECYWLREGTSPAVKHLDASVHCVLSTPQS